MDAFLDSNLFAALGAGAVALYLVALPVTLIALADSGQRANRLRFAIVFLIVSIATVGFFSIAWEGKPIAIRTLAFLLWLGLYAWLGRATVQRLNDIGWSKAFAFLLLIPYVNFGLAMLLLFSRPRRLNAPRRPPNRRGDLAMAGHESRNRRIAELLQEKGDSLDVPREVRHWAYFPTAEGRASFIALLGIRFESIACSEVPDSSAGPHAVIFKHVGLPDGDSMTRITDLLEQYALRCGGDYDGWETQVLA